MRLFFFLFFSLFNFNCFAGAALSLVPSGNVISQTSTGFSSVPGTVFGTAANDVTMSAKYAGTVSNFPTKFKPISAIGNFVKTVIKRNPIVFSATVLSAYLASQGLSVDSSGNISQFNPIIVSSFPLSPDFSNQGVIYFDNGVYKQAHYPSNQSPVPANYFNLAGTFFCDQFFVAGQGLGLCTEPTIFQSFSYGFINLGSVLPPPVSLTSFPANVDFNNITDPQNLPALNALAQSESIPVQLVSVNPVPVTQPLSPPQTSANGQTTQNFVTITQNPLNPATATVTTKQVELDSQGNPISDPAVNPEPDPLTPPEEDLCVSSPDRVSCMTAGELPDVDQLTDNPIQVTFSEQSGFGAIDSSCPPDLTSDFLGQQVAFSFLPVCTAAETFRPIVLGMAFITATLLAFGISNRVS